MSDCTAPHRGCTPVVEVTAGATAAPPFLHPVTPCRSSLPVILSLPARFVSGSPGTGASAGPVALVRLYLVLPAVGGAYSTLATHGADGLTAGTGLDQIGPQLYIGQKLGYGNERRAESSVGHTAGQIQTCLSQCTLSG